MNMGDEINIQEMVTKALENTIKEAASKIFKSGSKAYNSFQLSFGTAYHDYLDFVLDKYSKVKNILYKETPVYLYDFYVHVDLKYNNKTIETESVLNICPRSSRLNQKRPFKLSHPCT